MGFCTGPLKAQQNPFPLAPRQLVGERAQSESQAKETCSPAKTKDLRPEREMQKQKEK